MAAKSPGEQNPLLQIAAKPANPGDTAGKSSARDQSAAAATSGISRRDVLRTLAIGAAGGSVLQVIPAEAAEYIHELVRAEKSATDKSGSAPAKYSPKYFSPHQYATLIFLCDAIIPADEHSGGAVEGGAPEFIDLLTSENDKFQVRLGGGLMWLDGYCGDRYGTAFLDSTRAQKSEVLDLIAFRKNARKDATLSQGVAFFSLLRNMTCDAFYTSKIGIADLQYIGNTTLREFPGCPPPRETA
jgi:gluconate 2-dehydrogenase subunit 3-like protein